MGLFGQLRARAGFLADELLWRRLRLSSRTPAGVELRLASLSDWEVFQECFVYGEYDEAIALALEPSCPGRPLRVLDLGANVGFFSLRFLDLWLSRRHPAPLEITAVEGVARTFRQFQSNISSNRFDRAQVVGHHGVVGRREGEVLIYDGGSAHVNSLVPAGGRRSSLPFRAAYAVPARYLDLDHLVPAGQPVDLIKCDIEGAELEFLQNYPDLLRRTRYLAIEIHPKQCDASRCDALLRELAFSLVRTVREYPTAVHYLFARR